ncbi:flagellar hook-length control protein FliK [Burkholderia sp. WSM2230]|uniref:flagellar hook-length control protein FliK n=1 Tax=Burkholderia sp. WSM2230 TaxID=944435 RepID=UPI00041BB814|nr:flagellar hook-length control protein FliK [Burkholderia sp. WSM2230]
MNGIDTALASLLATRIDSLLNIGPGSAATTQTGAADVEEAPNMGAPVAPPAPPQPSAQTALSAVALTLNAIVRSGGEATPAIVGQTPIWPAAPALDVEVGALPLFDAPAASYTTSNTAGSAATANVAAAQVPVAALAAALSQTVSDSGLFYEAHLAQWLSGQRAPETLAGETQNRLVAAATQLPLNAGGTAGDASSASAAARPGMGAAPNGSSGAAGAGNPNAANAANAGNAADANAGISAGRAMPSIDTAHAARFVAGEVLASSLSDLNGQPAHAGLHNAASVAADGSAAQTAQAAAVHPATVPLVRQQLDLLATGQFRWTGEAWPGAKFDWTIEQEGDEWDRSGGGTASEEDQPWRTRLTLSLPTLGTVDAELTLTGMRLVARVQASPGGAARLAMQGESFRQRLAAAGIQLHGLTIREIGGGTPATGAAAAGAAAAAQAAASAYARSASAGASAASAAAAAATPGTASAKNARAALDDFDWDM